MRRSSSYAEHRKRVISGDKRSVLHWPKGHPVHHPYGATRHLRASALRPASVSIALRRDKLLEKQPCPAKPRGEAGRIGAAARSGHPAHSSPDPVELVNASSAAGLSENHLHD